MYNDNVFLSMHCVFYHTQSRDFFLCADPQHLKSKLAAKGIVVAKVIALIDDIYDMWRRLREPTQLFCSTGDAVQAVLDLLLLLDWRSMEIFASEQLAQALGVPHYLLAVKHPLPVAHSVIFANKVPVYVAHPISEVRALDRRGLKEQAASAREEVQELARLLVHSEVIVPFLPTTIDELIIRRGTGKPNDWMLALEERWPFDAESALFVAPTHTIMGPFDLPLQDNASDEGKAMALLLRSLAEAISSQVNSRDRRLVEQAQGLLAWRPCLNGRLSGGVTNEIAHRNALKELLGETQRRVFILNRPEDIALSRVEAALDHLEHTVSRLPGDREALRESLKDLALRKLVQDNGCVSGEEMAAALDPKGSVNFPLPRQHESSLGPDRAVAQRSVNVQTWSAVAKVANESKPPLSLDDTDLAYLDADLTVSEFVHRVEVALSRS